MKRFLSLVLSCVFILGLFAGCQSKEEKISDSQQKGSAQQQQPQNKQKVVIKWFHHYGEEGMRKWIDLLIKDFEQKNEGVKIETEALSADNYITTLKAKIASDDAPDIYDLPSIPDIRQFMQGGYVADLTDQPFMQNLSPACQDAALIDGRRWAMPIEQISFAVFYNKDVFEKAGITEVPDTWSKFIDACNKIAGIGISPIAAGYKENWTLICDNFTDHLPYTYGKAPTWSDDLETGKTTWSEDVAGFKEQLRRLYERSKYTNPDPFGTDWNKATELLATGKAGMILNGNWTIDTVKQKNPDARLGAFAMPFSDNPEDVKMPMGAAGGLIAYAKSPNLQTVFKFFEHITTKEMAEKFQLYRKGLSTVKGLSADFEPALNDIIKYQNEGKVFNLSVINRDFTQQYQKVFGDNLTVLLMQKEFDPDKFLKTMDEEFNRIRSLSK